MNRGSSWYLPAETPRVITIRVVQTHGKSHRTALKTAPECLFGIGLHGQSNGRRRKALDACGNGDVAGAARTHKSHRIAVIQFALRCVKRVVIEHVAVVDGYQLARAGDVEAHYRSAVGDHHIVGVKKCRREVGDIVPVRRERWNRRGTRCVREVGLVQAGGKKEVRGFACGAKLVAGNLFASYTGNRLERAGFV